MSYNETEKLATELKLENDKANVGILYDAKKHTVYMHKAFPANPKSIWVTEMITIE